MNNPLTRLNITARFLMHFHAVSTVVWVALIIPSIIWWRDSVPWLVAMSVWANVAGHFSAWQAARIETLHEEGGHE